MILFDIDNTLVDYSKSESETIRFIMDKYGLKLDQYGKYWKGISGKYFTKYLRQEMSFQEQGAQRVTTSSLPPLAVPSPTEVTQPPLPPSHPAQR